jgi:hypothetical protein
MIGAFVELGVTQALWLVGRSAGLEHRGTIRPSSRSLGQNRVHRPAGPVTGRAVVRRAVWRKRHEAV